MNNCSLDMFFLKFNLLLTLYSWSGFQFFSLLHWLSQTCFLLYSAASCQGSNNDLVFGRTDVISRAQIFKSSVQKDDWFSSFEENIVSQSQVSMPGISN